MSSSKEGIEGIQKKMAAASREKIRKRLMVRPSSEHAMSEEEIENELMAMGFGGDLGQAEERKTIGVSEPIKPGAPPVEKAVVAEQPKNQVIDPETGKVDQEATQNQVLTENETKGAGVQIQPAEAETAATVPGLETSPAVTESRTPIAPVAPAPVVADAAPQIGAQTGQVAQPLEPPAPIPAAAAQQVLAGEASAIQDAPSIPGIQDQTSAPGNATQEIPSTIGTAQAPVQRSSKTERQRPKTYQTPLEYRIVTPDTSGKGYRVTTLEKEDLSPVGHTEHATIEEAQQAAAEGATEHAGELSPQPGINVAHGAVGTNTSAEDVKKILAAKKDPNAYVPAIRIAGKIVRGKKGDTHIDILNRHIAEHPEDAEAVADFDSKENPNFFMRGESEISRKELKEALGVSHSQDLAKLQSEPSPEAQEGGESAAKSTGEPSSPIAGSPEISTTPEDKSNKAKKKAVKSKKQNEPEPVPTEQTDEKAADKSGDSTNPEQAQQDEPGREDRPSAQRDDPGQDSRGRIKQSIAELAAKGKPIREATEQDDQASIGSVDPTTKEIVINVELMADWVEKLGNTGEQWADKVLEEETLHHADVIATESKSKAFGPFQQLVWDTLPEELQDNFNSLYAIPTESIRAQFEKKLGSGNQKEIDSATERSIKILKGAEVIRMLAQKQITERFANRASAAKKMERALEEWEKPKWLSDHIQAIEDIMEGGIEESAQSPVVEKTEPVQEEAKPTEPPPEEPIRHERDIQTTDGNFETESRDQPEKTLRKVGRNAGTARGAGRQNQSVEP